jgi:hypothetical protein
MLFLSLLSCERASDLIPKEDDSIADAQDFFARQLQNQNLSKSANSLARAKRDLPMRLTISKVFNINDKYKKRQSGSVCN